MLIPLIFFHLRIRFPEQEEKTPEVCEVHIVNLLISAIGTATVLGSSLSHLTPDIQVYVDVDDMKHLASGHGQKHRVDEIILPQKAYKGGGSEN